MEGSFIAFSLLTVMAAVWWLKLSTPHPPTPSPTQAGREGDRQTPKMGLAVAIFGIAAGLALASKHPALFTVAAVFGGCGLWTIFEPLRRKDVGTQYIVSDDKQKQRPHSLLQRLAQLLIAGVLALTVFYILNPAWWGDPITRARQVLARRQVLLNEQVTFFGGYGGRGDALAGFLRQTFIAQPQYYEAPGWDEYIGDQIVRYDASGLGGVSIGGSVIGGVILGGLVVIGCWALLRTRTIPTSTRWLIGIWSLAMGVTTVLLTPIEWQRYYIPVYPAVGLLSALGVWWIVRMIRRVWMTKISGHDQSL